MKFAFRFGDSLLEITGTPASILGKDYRRSGTYRLEGDLLFSPTLNNGQPVHLTLQEGRLALTIDETLAFWLQRE